MTREREIFAAVVAVTLVLVLATALYAPPSLGPGIFTTTTALSTSSTASATSFSYHPKDPLQVFSVTAQTFRDNTTGKVYLTLRVGFKNVGGAPVYVTGGCGSSLTARIAPNSVISESSGPRCLCAEFIAPLNPGDSASATTPGCWSGVTYLVVHPGTISVNLTLSFWSDQNYQKLGSTSILANIVVA